MADNQSINPSNEKVKISKAVVEDLLKPLLVTALKDTDILAVIIFGSYSRHEVFNDIDVCLITKDYPSSIDLQRRYTLNYSDLLDIHIFDQLPLYIQIEVCRDGDIRINKDYYKIFDIYLSTFRSWDSFFPRLKMIIE